MNRLSCFGPWMITAKPQERHIRRAGRGGESRACMKAIESKILLLGQCQ